MKKKFNHDFDSIGVSTDFYLKYMDGGIYSDLDSIPINYKPFLYDQPDREVRDFVSFLKGKKEWVIETMEQLQPHSFEVFQSKASPLFIGMRLYSDPRYHGKPQELILFLFFDVCERMVEVRPRFAGSTYEDGDDCFGHLSSLPDELAKSWLWRTGGWRIPGELPEYISTYRQLIGHPAYSWPETDVYLDTLGRGYKKKYLPKIVERFPDCAVEARDKYDKKHHYFKCFLDTRPSGLSGPVGDQFFVCTKRTDQIVYHIHRGDVDNIRVLHNPAEAIDRYCAHTLLRTPSEFDFMPWSEPLSA